PRETRGAQCGAMGPVTAARAGPAPPPPAHHDAAPPPVHHDAAPAAPVGYNAAPAGHRATRTARAARAARAARDSRPSMLAWLPYLIVLAGAAAGMLLVWQGSKYAGR